MLSINSAGRNEGTAMSKTQTKKAAAATKAVFDWADPFDLESQFSEEERAVRDTARDYAQEKLMPRIKEFYLKASLDCSARPSPRNMAAPGSPTFATGSWRARSSASIPACARR